MAAPLSLRVAEAEGRVYRRVWRGSAVTSFLNPILYLLAMGVGLGTLVDQNLPQGIEGMSYLTYLAPGLLAATAMQTGAGEGAWKVMAGIVWRRTYEATLATPIGISHLVYGHLLWSVTRVVMVSAVFALVMAAFQVTSVAGALLALFPAVLTGAALASPVSAYTANLKSVQGLNTLWRFVIIPMFLFSGAFFPIDQLPGWMQSVAYATPLFHGVELCRWAALGVEPAVQPSISVLYLVGWFAVGTVLAVASFRKRLRT